MKRIFCFVVIMLAITYVNAQNKYTYQEVLDFKNGMLDSARKMTKSVPMQVNEIQTLYAVAVMDNLITYKYEIARWDGNVTMTKEETNQMKSLTALNMLRSQEYQDMFLECLKRTKLEFQFMFFSEDRKYIGGFRLGYNDFL